MFDEELLKRAEQDLPIRKLKIEEAGDFWRGLTIPKIRLMGRWLERAGFLPGELVSVTGVAPGVIELRAPNALLLSETPQPSAGQADEPF